MVSLLLIVFAFSFTTQTVFSQNAALIVNTTTEDGNDTANDVVNYIATIRNTGDVALNSVSLTSNLAGLTLTVDEDGNGDAVLDVGEAWTYIGSYTNAAGTSVSSTFSLTSAEITTPITYSHTEAVHEDDYATTVIKVLPFLKLDDITVTEGDNPVAMVPVSISHPSTEAIDVQITQTNGSAVGSDDYTETTITVTIPAGQTSITVDIPITNDNIGESTESFTVNGTSSSTCPATPSTVTILDDDTPVVILDDVTVTEGTDPVATIPVSISNPSDETIVVEITQTTGTAGTADYTVTTIEVTFLAGETNTTVNIPITNDLLLEITESFSVNGTVTSGNATNATPSTVTILDNDINAIVIGSVIVTEGTDAVATVPVSITNPSVLPTVVTITQTIGSAGTDDYTSTTITVTIPAGATTTTVDIPITNDNIHEATESFTVNGTSPTATSGAPGIVTILEDPTDVPVVTIGDVVVTEGDVATVPVTLSNPSSTPTEITIVQTNGSTQGAPDYVATTIVVTIPAGATSTSITLDTVEDTTNEPTETFNVNGTVTSGTATQVNNGSVQINDDDNPPVVTIGDVVVDEGDVATVPVTLSNPSSTPTEITIVQTNGSTQGAPDYVATTIVVTIPAGATSTSITLDTVEDTTNEPTETFNVNGTVTSGTATQVNNGSVQINDDDNPPVVTIGDVVVTEGDVATVPVTLSNPSSTPTEITILQTNGSTQGAPDYVATTIVVTIPAGATSTSITLDTVEDTTNEPTETFNVNGTVTSGTATQVNNGSVQINDDDNPPVVTIGDVVVTEGDVATVPVTLSNPSSTPTEITIVQTNGSTQGAPDYVATTIVVTIPAGATSTSITLDTVEDTTNEPTETFNVNGTVTSGTATQVNNGSVQINDDDNPPVVTIGDVVVDEGDVATVPVTLSNPSSTPTEITIVQTNGSTQGAPDYVATTIVVTIPAGATSTSITLDTVEDTTNEPTETFNVNGTVTSGTATQVNNGSVQINDDDNPPVVTIGDVVVTEGDVATVPVTLSNPSSTPTEITIVQTNGSTQGAPDYVATTIVVTIPAGATSTSITLDTVEDTTNEPTETFNVNGTVTSGTATQVNNGSVQINDDDNPPVVTIGDVVVDEGDVATVPVTLSNPSSTPTEITIVQTNGSTQGAPDYVAITIVVTIPAGATSTSITLDTVEDTTNEPTETFNVNGTVTSGTATQVNNGSVQINDDDNPPVVTIGDVVVTEGDVATVPVTLSNPSSTPTEITIVQTNGSTQGAPDYVATTIVVTIPAGATSTSITLDTVEDTTNEPTETFNVNGTVTSGTATQVNNGSVQINDDDNPPVVTIGDVVVDEGDVATVPVTLSNPSSTPTEITIVQTNGSTQGAPDYVATTIVVTIPAGATSTSITLDTVEDTTNEPTETFNVNGTVTSGTATQVNNGSVQINDDDNPPVVTIGDVVVDEGDVATVPVTLSNPSSNQQRLQSYKLMEVHKEHRIM
ncbi:beta strand repeat-containing protein [Tenacibaculum aquimarinum]|uniref:beta strand repeat-containing protein n=1 Tax=Tenacibaculum aquimarinum TaxID=2910675 RepID=UPI001F0AF203|nr:Calx-beta domain-containing protein [Tenacibaculum aquimarinum]MCH3885547.1 hypothetical protein [Tenacibaculum aquimarinum]